MFKKDQNGFLKYFCVYYLKKRTYLKSIFFVNIVRVKPNSN